MIERIGHEFLVCVAFEKHVMEKQIDDKVQIVTTGILRNGETIMLTDNHENQKLKPTGKQLLIFLTPKIMNENGDVNL